MCCVVNHQLRPALRRRRRFVNQGRWRMDCRQLDRHGHLVGVNRRPLHRLRWPPASRIRPAAGRRRPNRIADGNLPVSEPHHRPLVRPASLCAAGAVHVRQCRRAAFLVVPGQFNVDLGIHRNFPHQRADES